MILNCLRIELNWGKRVRSVVISFVRFFNFNVRSILSLNVQFTNAICCSQSMSQSSTIYSAFNNWLSFSCCLFMVLRTYLSWNFVRLPWWHTSGSTKFRLCCILTYRFQTISSKISVKFFRLRMNRGSELYIVCFGIHCTHSCNLTTRIWIFFLIKSNSL